MSVLKSTRVHFVGCILARFVMSFSIVAVDFSCVFFFSLFILAVHKHNLLPPVVRISFSFFFSFPHSHLVLARLFSSSPFALLMCVHGSVLRPYARTRRRDRQYKNRKEDCQLA